jgi:hypothetical protein
VLANPPGIVYRPRNHFLVGMAGIAEMVISGPGDSSVPPLDAAPMGKTLMLNSIDN